jgi:hypothetical protein
MLACKTAPYRDGEIAAKVRFLADKPFRVVFRASADFEFSVCVNLTRVSSSYPYRNSLRLHRDGLYHNFYYEESGHDPRVRLTSGAVYEMEAKFDGSRTFRYFLNGAEVRTFQIPEGRLTGLRDIEVRLGTAGSDRRATAFDNVILEGTVVTEPSARPTRRRGASEAN